jgi:hypothetical protein
MQRVNVFDPTLTKRNKMSTFLFFKSFTNILRTSSLLIPVISSNIRILRFRSSAKHFLMTSVDSSLLEVVGSLQIHRFVSTLAPLFEPFMLFTHIHVLDKQSSLYALSTIQTFQ